MRRRLVFVVAALLGAAVATSALARGGKSGRSSTSSAHAHSGQKHFRHGFGGGFHSSTSSAPLTAATMNAIHGGPHSMPPSGYHWCAEHNTYYPPGVDCSP